MPQQRAERESICSCCLLPFRPRAYDGDVVQVVCDACLPHKQILGENEQRIMARLTDHATRATSILLGARREVHDLRAKLDQLHEERRNRASDNSWMYEKLEAVAALHGAVGDTRRCACGLAVDNCQTLPLVARYRPKS